MRYALTQSKWSSTNVGNYVWLHGLMRTAWPTSMDESSRPSQPMLPVLSHSTARFGIDASHTSIMKDWKHSSVRTWLMISALTTAPNRIRSVYHASLENNIVLHIPHQQLAQTLY